MLRNPSFTLMVRQSTNLKSARSLPTLRQAADNHLSCRARLQIVDPLSTPIALSIFASRADGTTGALVESTGPYSDVVGGVVTKLFRLSANEHGECTQRASSGV